MRIVHPHRITTINGEGPCGGAEPLREIGQSSPGEIDVRCGKQSDEETVARAW